MARIDVTMQSLGNDPKTCHRKFTRGETMYAVLYDNGEPAGWHTTECIEHWKKTGEPYCKDV